MQHNHNIKHVRPGFFTSSNQDKGITLLLSATFLPGIKKSVLLMDILQHGIAFIIVKEYHVTCHKNIYAVWCVTLIYYTDLWPKKVSSFLVYPKSILFHRFRYFLTLINHSIGKCDKNAAFWLKSSNKTQKWIAVESLN